MKLYAFQPTGHGQLSFFVMAESESEAIEYLNVHINKKYKFNNGSYKYEAEGWGTDDYKLTIMDEGHVIENDND